MSRSVGIVGGLGHESTIDYYRRIVEVWRDTRPGSAPSIQIDSLDVDLGIQLVRTDQPALAEYLLASVTRLARAGSDFAVFAANTPHLVFDEVAASAPIPLLSIVETCAAEASSRGFERVGILGTGFTMEADFYPAVFGRLGIDVLAPSADERVWLHEKYLGELLQSVFLDETRAGVGEIIQRLEHDEGVQAILLAGTELPLLLGADAASALPVLDTSELHVRAIVADLLGAACDSPGAAE